jgi:hypothetical protein
VGLFVKPLMEVMNENSKAAQAGAAMCIAKVVECAGSDSGMIPIPLFQKLSPRICKLLGVQGFLAKGALLSVISSLAQVCLILFVLFILLILLCAAVTKVRTMWLD